MEGNDVSVSVRERRGAAASVDMLSLFESTRHEWSADVLSAAVEQYERRLATEVSLLRTEIRASEAALRMQIDTHLDALRASLQAELRGSRADLLRWSLLLSLAQTGTIALIVVTLFALAD